MTYNKSLAGTKKKEPQEKKSLLKKLISFFKSDGLFKFLVFFITGDILVTVGLNHIQMTIKVLMVFGCIFAGCLLSIFADYVLKEVKKL